MKLKLSNAFTAQNVTLTDYLEFAQGIRRHADQFRNKFLTNRVNDLAHGLAPGSVHPKLRELDGWYRFPQTPEVMSALTSSVLDFYEFRKKHVGLGHDLRHMLIKDLASAIIFSQEGGLGGNPVEGYKRLSLFVSLCHDLGRLLEEHFDRVLEIPEDQKLPHEYFSFAYTKWLIEGHPTSDYVCRFEAPMNQILYGVLAHAGKNAGTAIGELAQFSDREQIIGPEGILREIAYRVALMGQRIAPAEAEVDPQDYGSITNVYQSQAHKLRSMNRALTERHFDPVTLHAGPRRLKSISLTFLVMACDDEQFNQLFAQEIQRENDENLNAGSIISPNIWRAAMLGIGREHERFNDLDNEKVTDDADQLTDIIISALSNRGNAEVKSVHSERIKAAVEFMTEDQRIRFSAALDYVVEQQAKLDQQMYDKVRSYDFKPGSMEAQMVEAITGDEPPKPALEGNFI